jgi:hypothetical protein
LRQRSVTVIDSQSVRTAEALIMISMIRLMVRRLAA